MAVSAPRSDCQSMRGARGEAHAKEWPGAMIPALPAVASRPSPSFSSTTVTSWPALARKYAGGTPTTPPPRTRAFTARSRPAEVACAHRSLRMEHELAPAAEVGGAGDRRQDRATPLDRGLAGGPVGDPLRQLPPHGETEMPGLDDGEDVADADRDVDRNLARALDLDDSPGKGHERRRPAQRDLADAILVPPRDRLDNARLGIDQDGRLRTLTRHHAGLDGHGRRADRALAARHVVAAGIDEEEPEPGVGRDGLGHHRDQEGAVPARLEAEAGAEMVEMLLDPAALLTDSASGQPLEAARQEPHTDPRRVEVDRPEHAIGAHSHLPGPDHETAWGIALSSGPKGADAGTRVTVLG